MIKFRSVTCLPSSTLTNRSPTSFPTIFASITYSQYTFTLFKLNRRATAKCMPSAVPDVMRDLNDPVILKELDAEGVTVVELPTEEEEGMMHSLANKLLFTCSVNDDLETVEEALTVCTDAHSDYNAYYSCICSHQKNQAVKVILLCTNY